MLVTLIVTVVGTLIFAIFAPILGCLLDGIDRKLSARMQGRVGPSILQPYYDVRKLFAKEKASVNTVEGTYIACALIFALIAGGVFYTGGNLLLCVFIITLSSLFFIMAAYSTRSPYAEIGAHRETLQVMCYEPMVLIMAIVFYQCTGSFDLNSAFDLNVPMISVAFGAWIGLMVILTIKLRKSPFDISSSHHAHQEIVRGITTEMSGPTLARVEIMHWCENILFLGWVGMFFVSAAPNSLIVAIIVAIVAYLFEIWIDNNFARVKWQAMLKVAWICSLAFGGINIAVLAYVM